MNENRVEKLEIPNILLDINGLRTASREVDAETVAEANKILTSHRIVEAGVVDFLKNLIKSRRVSPEEVEALLTKIKGIDIPRTPGRTINEEQHNAMIEFLQNINQKTKGRFLNEPFQRGMNPNWQQLDEVTEQASAGVPGAFEAMQQSMGATASNIEMALKKYWRVIKWFTGADESLLSKPMVGVYKLADHGQQIPITYKQFFEGAGSMVYGPGGPQAGNIVMSSPDAVKVSLAKLATTVGASTTLRGLAQTTATAAYTITAVPFAAGVAGTMWGFGQGIKNAPQMSDYEKASSDQSFSVNPSLNNNPASIQPPVDKLPQSNGLGGTTNGSNLGNFGGQYSPNSDLPTSLPQNKNDWLPTTTSDYYNLVNRKSNNEYDSNRIAQVAQTVDDIDEVVKNVLTILEQGQPGEQTLEAALNYVRKEDAKAQTFLQEYQAQPNPNVNPIQVNKDSI